MELIKSGVILKSVDCVKFKSLLAKDSASFCFDITKQKETDGLYRELIEKNHEGFCLVDKTGKIMDVNDSYIRLSGYTRNELLTMKISDLEGCENPNEITNHMEAISKNGYDRFETTHRKKNGTLVDIEVSISYYPIWDGIFTVFCRDISEIRNVIRRLEVEKRTAQNLVEAKTNFLTAMSHEIRTPLNGAMGMIRLLYDNAHEDEIKVGLSQTLQACESLNNVINEILDYSKIESGKMQIEKKDFNIIELINSVSIFFNLMARQKGLSLIFDIDPKIPVVLTGDAYRIKQILVNLVGNALKFTKEGNICVLLKLVHREYKTAKISFSITDTGIGIDPEALKNLVNPFFQADSSISRKFGGSGLGLNISNNLLKLMNSHLEIESALRKGSTFKFNLELEIGNPNFKKSLITESDQTSVRQVFADTIPLLAGMNLVVAEDDKMSQVVIGGYLKSAKINYTLVENGEDCVKLIRQFPDGYDAILMDIHMPGMNGLLATEELKKLNVKIPIIALTAGVTQDEQTKCLDSGMCDVLTKPIDPLQFALMLNKHFPHHDYAEISENL